MTNSHRDLLLQSINQYKELLAMTKQIGDQINHLETVDMRNYLEDLRVLLNSAKKTDTTINTFKKTIKNISIDKLLRDRFEIMKQFLELNDTVASKISAKKAVVQSEFQKIKNGRTGLQGYQSTIKKPNRFVNNTA